MTPPRTNNPAGEWAEPATEPVCTTRQLLPLTAAQKAIWFAQLLSPEVPFVIAQYTELHGDVDLSLLTAATRRAHRELGIGSVRLVEDDEEPLLLVTDAVAVPVAVLDLRDETNPVDAAHAWMRTDRESAFDIHDEHLVRSSILRLSDDHSYWYSRAHHIALDGYGAMQLISRTAELYVAAIEGREPPGRPEVTARQLLDEDLRYARSTRRERDRDFWLDQAADLPSPISLGGGSGQPGITAHRVGAPVSGPVGARLDRGGLRSTLEIIAAFAAFLALMTGSDDVLLSLPVSARTSAVLRNSAGSVSNVLPLRLRRVLGATVGSVLHNTQATLTAALRHQRYRREDIGRDLGSGSSDPAQFGPVLNLMMFNQEVSLGDVAGSVHVLSTGPTADLSVNVYPGSADSVPRIDFEGNSAVYGEAELAAHHRRFMAFLCTFTTADPSTPVADLDLFLPGERTDSAPALGAADRPPTTLDQLLTTTAERSADAVALHSAEGTLTYGELDRRSNQVARALIARGAGPETPVAVAVPRSVESVVALWAVAKTGAAYVPIDPTHPVDRISFTLADSGTALGLTVSHSRHHLPDAVEWLPLDDPATDALCRSMKSGPIGDSERTAALQPTHPAYLIYTSGSTGTRRRASSSLMPVSRTSHRKFATSTVSPRPPESCISHHQRSTPRSSRFWRPPSTAPPW
nr:condensation domain-containing protein [Rhodococcus opacus]